MALIFNNSTSLHSKQEQCGTNQHSWLGQTPLSPAVNKYIIKYITRNPKILQWKEGNLKNYMACQPITLFCVSLAHSSLQIFENVKLQIVQS